MGDRITFGREGCDYVITDDDYVSTRHAEVWTDQSGQAWVADLGSTNGTRILPAGQRVPTTPLGAALAGAKVTGPTRLHPGDTLIVGRTLIPWTPRREPIRVQVVDTDGA